MTEHASGPWYAIGQDVFLDREGLAMTEPVAHCRAGKEGRAAAKANARLISAAPDLLAACAAAEQALRDGGTFPIKGMLWEQLSAALKKARLTDK